MKLITLDLETYYDKDYSLSKLTTEAYVRHPLFEVIGLSIKLGEAPARWFPKTQVAAVISRIPWKQVAVLAHNTLFDGMILAHHYGVSAGLWLDTKSMAKPFHHATGGCALNHLAKEYNLGTKGDEVIHALGKRFADFSEEELARYGQYCCNDTELTYELFAALRPRVPPSELLFIDRVLRTAINPQLVWDAELLDLHHTDVITRKQALTDKVASVCPPDALSSNAKFISVLERLGGRWPREMMESDERYDAYLKDMAHLPFKFLIPHKVRDATPTEVKKGITGEVNVWALAKKDEEFLALQEIEDDTLQAVIAARLGTKSTIAETRAARMIEAAGRGAYPIPLAYYAAHTGRLGGMDGVNVQNFPKAQALTEKDVGFLIMTPQGADILRNLADGIAQCEQGEYPAKDCTTISIRHALRAPEGKRLVVVDASQIEARIVAWLAGCERLVEGFRNKEDIYSGFASAVYGYPVNKKEHPTQRFVGKTCIAEGQRVLTNAGLIEIQAVTCFHKVWDGVEWVATEGAIYQGEQEVLTYDSLTATANHQVYLSDGTRCSFAEAAKENRSIAVTGNGGAAIRYGGDNVSSIGAEGTPPVPGSTLRRLNTSPVDSDDALRGNRGPLVSPVSKTKRRVWDLLNCGPRHRFTVEGRLVSNCILGLGFGTGHAKLQTTLAVGQGDVRVQLALEECKRIVDTYRKELYPEIPALWEAAKQALEFAFHGQEMVFGIDGLLRTGENCIWLPNGMPIIYHGLRTTEKGEFEYWGKKDGRYQWVRIYGPKIVENCIASGTLVLTDSGWKPIENIELSDRVHDGVEFVTHGGKVLKSVQPCTMVDGVYMTPDHEVLTDEGWKTASQFPRPYRPTLRNAAGYRPLSYGWSKVALAFSLRLRKHRYIYRGAPDAGSKAGGHPQLWLRHFSPAIGRQQKARHEQAPGVRRLAEYAISLSSSVAQSVGQLWWEGYYCLRTLERRLREFLGGYGAYVPAGTGTGSYRQQRGLYARELPMGNTEEQRHEQAGHHPRGGCPYPSCRDGDKSVDAVLSDTAWLDGGGITPHPLPIKQVWDILNCGPRHRFVVKGIEGPFIVHNCVQALARIVISDAWVRLSKKYAIAMQVHDELMACVDEDKAEECLADMIREMSTAPAWAAGLPLDAEGALGLTYADAK